MPDDHFWDHADFELTVTDHKGLILFSTRIVGIKRRLLGRSALGGLSQRRKRWSSQLGSPSPLRGRGVGDRGRRG